MGTSRGYQRWKMAQGGKHPPKIAEWWPRHEEMVGGGGTVKGASRPGEGMWPVGGGGFDLDLGSGD